MHPFRIPGLQVASSGTAVIALNDRIVGKKSARISNFVLASIANILPIVDYVTRIWSSLRNA